MNEMPKIMTDRAALSIMLGQRVTPRKVDRPNIEIPQFSSYQLRRLEFERYDHIYTLTGRPIKEIMSNNVYKQKIWGVSEECLKYDTPVNPIQVAINPRKLIFQKSDNKSAEEQIGLIDKYSNRQDVPGVKAIMLEAPHVVELLLQHWLATEGECLLGKEHGYKFVRTSTPTGKDSFASAGCFSEALGLRVRSDPPFGNKDIVALRALVPA
jgi:hypothetical protein